MIASLIDQVNAKGERLAALDVAKTFLGADVANNLAMLDPISTDLEGGNTRSGRGLATMSAPSRRRSGRRRPSTTLGQLGEDDAQQRHGAFHDQRLAQLVLCEQGLPVYPARHQAVQRELFGRLGPCTSRKRRLSLLSGAGRAGFQASNRPFPASLPRSRRSASRLIRPPCRRCSPNGFIRSPERHTEGR